MDGEDDVYRGEEDRDGREGCFVSIVCVLQFNLGLFVEGQEVERLAFLSASRLFLSVFLLLFSSSFFICSILPNQSERRTLWQATIE